MATSNVQGMAKKYFGRIAHSLVYMGHTIYKKITIMNRYEQIFVIALLIITALLIVSPIMILSPNEGASGSQYIFLLGSLQLIKTAIVIFFGLGLTLAWHLSTKVKNYIIEYIGFNKNPYLFSFFLLFSVLAVLMSIGEMNNVLSDYTTMLRMHFMYYIIRVLLTCIVGYCIYMLLYSSHGEFKGTVVGYHNKTQSHGVQDDDMQGLFDNLKDS